MLPIEVPLKQFFGLDGRPLDGGYVWIGEENENPETVPVSVYWDLAGTQPAAQPIRTLNGYPVRNGSPAQVFVDGVYSITVKDCLQRLVVYSASSVNFDYGAILSGPDGASIVGVGDVALSVVLRDRVSRVVNSISDLRALSKDENARVLAIGQNAAGDGGGGMYFFDASDMSSADNGSTVIVGNDGARWILASSGRYPPGAGTEDQSVENFFYPRRAALRTGGSDTLPQNDERNYWRGLANKNAWRTEANIGLFSTAFNRNGASYGSYSNTFGHDCIAYGVASLAGGAGSCAGDPDNPTSPAFQGYCSFAWGKNVLAAGSKSAALCEESLAYGRASLAAGYSCQTAGFSGDDGTGAVALGYQSQAWGNYSIAHGRHVKAYNGQVLVGSGINNSSPMLSDTNNALGIGAGVVSPQIELIPGSGSAADWGRMIVRGVNQRYYGNFGATLSEATQTLTNGTSGGYGEFHIRPLVAGTLANGWSVDAGRTGGVVSLLPVTDNATWLGGPANRTAVVYAVSGTINTSDAREKNWLGDLSAAEMRVAVSLSKLIGMYQWTESVQKKGADARVHIGVKAQDVESAFAAEGLDGMRYGVLCYDEWEERPEVKNEAGDVTEPARAAGNRYGVRHDQLAMWIAAGFEHRLAVAGI